MKQYLQQKEWLNLPQNTRLQFVHQFNIHRSEGVVVMGGEIRSDGSSQQDLINGLTIGKMIECVGNDWDKVDNNDLFEHLLEKVIKKFNEKPKKESDSTDETKKASGKGSKKTKSVGKTNTRSSVGKQSDSKGSTDNASSSK